MGIGRDAVCHSTTHGLANISGNRMHVSYRPGPVPVNVSGNISSDFIRSRTKPAFRLGILSVSEVCRGIARKIVNQEVKLCQVEERFSLGVCPCLYGGGWGGGVVLCLCVFRHIDPDRPIIYKQWFALSACSHCEVPLFMLQPFVSSLRTVLEQQLRGMVTNNCKKNKSPLQIRLKAVWPARMIFNIYHWL